MATYPGIYSITHGVARQGSKMVVTCPKNLPLNHMMVLLVSVMGRADYSSDHDFHAPEVWGSVAIEQNNYAAAAVSYKQLWMWSKLVASGDESWEFESKLQNPNRLWVLLVIKNQNGEGWYDTQKTGSASNVTAQTFPACTAQNIGDLQLLVTTQNLDEEEITDQPRGYDRIACFRSPANGTKVLAADMTIWKKNATASGAIAAVPYTSISDTYASFSLVLKRGTGATTFDNSSAGWISLPKVSLPGMSRIEHAIGYRPDDAVAGALASENNSPVLLADLDPLVNDSPGAASAPVKFSSGYYSKDYLPAIRSIPEIRQSLYADGVVGGKAGETTGALELINDRDKAPGEA